MRWVFGFLFGIWGIYMDLASIHGHVTMLMFWTWWLAGIKWNLKSMIFWRISWPIYNIWWVWKPADGLVGFFYANCSWWCWWFCHVLSQIRIIRGYLTRWCPSLLAKLVQITPITMVYSKYNYSIHAVFVNQRSHHVWGHHPATNEQGFKILTLILAGHRAGFPGDCDSPWKLDSIEWTPARLSHFFEKVSFIQAKEKSINLKKPVTLR